MHFGVGGHVDVDHRLELRDVEPACGDVGGHQHRAAAVGELDQHLIAFALLHLSMQGERVKAFGAQQLDQCATLLARVAKGQGADRAEVTQQGGDSL